MDNDTMTGLFGAVLSSAAEFGQRPAVLAGEYKLTYQQLMTSVGSEGLFSPGGRLRGGIRRLRRQPDLGLNFIKHAGLIFEQERLQLCESQ